MKIIQKIRPTAENTSSQKIELRLIHNHNRLFIQINDCRGFRPKFRPVIMSRTSIEIYINHTRFDGINEFINIQIAQHSCLIIMEIGYSQFFFHFGLHKKTIQQFRSGLTKQIIEAPIRHRIQRAKLPDPLFNGLQPFLILVMNAGCIELDAHFTFTAINNDVKTAGISRRAKSSPKRFFRNGIFPSCVLMCPTITRQ